MTRDRVRGDKRGVASVGWRAQSPGTFRKPMQDACLGWLRYKGCEKVEPARRSPSSWNNQSDTVTMYSEGGKIKFPLLREICQNICGCVLKVTLYKVNPSIYTQRHHSSNFPLSPIPSTFTSLFDHHHYCGNILLFSHLKKNFLQIHCNSFTPLHKTPQRSCR